MTDAYDEIQVPIAPGENQFNLETGELSRKDPEERSNIWKDSGKIAKLSDDSIRLMGTRANGIEDYRIQDVSVSYRGMGNGEKRAYLCHTHVCSDCPHIRRVKQFREERAA